MLSNRFAAKRNATKLSAAHYACCIYCSANFAPSVIEWVSRGNLIHALSKPYCQPACCRSTRAAALQRPLGSGIAGCWSSQVRVNKANTKPTRKRTSGGVSQSVSWLTDSLPIISLHSSKCWSNVVCPQAPPQPVAIWPTLTLRFPLLATPTQLTSFHCRLLWLLLLLWRDAFANASNSCPPVVRLCGCAARQCT